ncbi:MAG: hypothetical protein M1524_00505 [Patescibacteria group bacterium]|nr:hypothetical protein [Patescibacteria group bacterium]
MLKGSDKKILKVRSFKQIKTRNPFKKHYLLTRHSYIGYQVVNSLFNRKILNNTEIWLKSYYINNLPDEEPFLHFLFSRYNWAFVPNIFVIKDMTESNYYSISALRQFVPLFWNFVACSGIIAQTNYKSRQKIQLITLKFLRNIYIFFDILSHDLQTSLKA